ncbi:MULTISPECIES: LysR family transcriptional regulator [Cupriavidus]|uniref:TRANSCRIPTION REGULATOR, HTH lysR family ttuA activator n=1 Tax=Cupriavidus taiwanensis TaxID=164546 RepID=A0A9Q7XUR5_9BURK|nr:MULTISPECIES: LysR family transcriptional regulator [Cupriavidus]MEC3766222.1 LysR family transcriptional regulator [Cupriavidus sp. SS-3]SPD68110.1 putative TRANSCRIPTION REGULATOR, HTH lysR family ttuA activator [Cupriavidus taiwanensis]
MAANSAIQPAELGFFTVLATAGSLSAAARDLGITTAAVSKRLGQMEARIGMPLVIRTTRRMSLTPEGEVLLEHARRILGELDDLEQLLTSAKGRPSGLLRVNATLGFGRMHVAPVISDYSRMYPEVDVQLQLSADPPPLSEDAFDVCVRFGEPPDARIVARKLAPNRRLLVASPGYLRKHGTPQVPADLPGHNCIGIRQGSDAYGVWRLTPVKGARARTEAIHVRGNLTTNDGEIAVNWALEGHGIVLRAEWDVDRYLRSGRLVQVLPQYATPEANIYAVYQQRHQLSSRIRLFVEYLAEKFAAFGK